MFGHYRTLNNRVICVMQKAKTTLNSIQTKRRMSLRQQRRNKGNPYIFEVPDQDFNLVRNHLDF